MSAPSQIRNTLEHAATQAMRKAADYLTKFAKLIRIVLEKSGHSFIPLAEELDCLKLYMDLEALRFEKPFIYEIRSDGLDQEMVGVPSLLIQQFVENAIWNGLNPKQDQTGKLRICLLLEQDILHCEISDNGIGLSGSALRKTKEQDTKKSLGIELTKNRLRLADSSKIENQAKLHFFENFFDMLERSLIPLIERGLKSKKFYFSKFLHNTKDFFIHCI